MAEENTSETNRQYSGSNRKGLDPPTNLHLVGVVNNNRKGRLSSTVMIRKYYGNIATQTTLHFNNDATSKRIMYEIVVKITTDQLSLLPDNIGAILIPVKMNHVISERFKEII
uniref:DUF223 domain-containing protein n=1 Tax=Strongyloides venezuelensis TaxID=75913 RepID=A0A0K0FAX4_STRVS